MCRTILYLWFIFVNYIFNKTVIYININGITSVWVSSICFYLYCAWENMLFRMSYPWSLININTHTFKGAKSPVPNRSDSAKFSVFSFCLIVLHYKIMHPIDIAPPVLLLIFHVPRKLILLHHYSKGRYAAMIVTSIALKEN